MQLTGIFGFFWGGSTLMKQNNLALFIVQI